MITVQILEVKPIAKVMKNLTHNTRELTCKIKVKINHNVGDYTTDSVEWLEELKQFYIALRNLGGGIDIAHLAELWRGNGSLAPFDTRELTSTKVFHNAAYTNFKDNVKSRMETIIKAMIKDITFSIVKPDYEEDESDPNLQKEWDDIKKEIKS